MKVQIVTPYRVSHLQRYGVTGRGNVTSVYPPLGPRGTQATEADKTKLPSNCPKSIPFRTRSKMLTSCSGVGGLEAKGG
jgi:hypothetical protein